MCNLQLFLYLPQHVEYVLLDKQRGGEAREGMIMHEGAKHVNTLTISYPMHLIPSYASNVHVVAC